MSEGLLFYATVAGKTIRGKYRKRTALFFVRLGSVQLGLRCVALGRVRWGRVVRLRDLHVQK